MPTRSPCVTSRFVAGCSCGRMHNSMEERRTEEEGGAKAERSFITPRVALRCVARRYDRSSKNEWKIDAVRLMHNVSRINRASFRSRADPSVRFSERVERSPFTTETLSFRDADPTRISRAVKVIANAERSRKLSVRNCVELSKREGLFGQFLYFDGRRDFETGDLEIQILIGEISKNLRNSNRNRIFFFLITRKL